MRLGRNRLGQLKKHRDQNRDDRRHEIKPNFRMLGTDVCSDLVNVHFVSHQIPPQEKNSAARSKPISGEGGRVTPE